MSQMSHRTCWLAQMLVGVSTTTANDMELPNSPKGAPIEPAFFRRAESMIRNLQATQLPGWRMEHPQATW